MEPDARGEPDDGAPTETDASSDDDHGAGPGLPPDPPTDQFLDGYVPI